MLPFFPFSAERSSAKRSQSSSLSTCHDLLPAAPGPGVPTTYVNDLYQYDTVALAWKNLTSLPGAPSPRNAHGITSIGTSLYVFGGLGPIGPLPRLEQANVCSARHVPVA